MPPIDRAQLTSGVLAGLAGGTAFAGVMVVDIRLSREDVNDFRLLADIGPFRDMWRTLGPVIHALNSASLGAIFAVVSDRLPGPAWLRGVTFALAENVVLWPVIIVLDRIHPAIRAGTLPRYNRPWPFLAETLRHTAYGVVLGTTYERLQRRQALRTTLAHRDIQRDLLSRLSLGELQS